MRGSLNNDDNYENDDLYENDLVANLMRMKYGLKSII